MKLYKGSKFLITVRPTMTAANVVAATTADDIVFNWTSFKFPKYPFAAKLTSVTVMIQGADEARVEEPLDLYFAQPNPDGTAPLQLGPDHAPIDMADGGCYRNILGHVSILAADFDDHIPYNAFAQIGQSRGAVADVDAPGIILGSEALTSNDEDDFTHLYVCAQAAGDVEFGTTLLMNADQAATTTSTTIVIKGGDARKVFSIGDTIHAADGAKIGIITGFGDAAGANKDTRIILGDGVVEAVEEDDEVINLQPITSEQSILSEK